MSTQALIAETRTLMQDLVATETAEGALLSAIAEGRAFAVGAKTSVSSADAALRIENPAGSGKLLMLFKFTLSCNMKVDVQFVKDAGLLGGTERAPFNLNWSSANAPVATVFNGSGILDGGTVLSPVLNLPADIPWEMQLPILIPPGGSAAARMSIGALSSADFYSSVFWYEKDI